MKKQFHLSIPEPCHEDWSKMTPKEKGRFCQSCSKTVMDFTQKSREEIHEYLTQNSGTMVCGHFRREQLDAITIEIPQTTFHQTLSFQKLFLLALLLVMGSSLFSCQPKGREKQKIENVILIDTQEDEDHSIDTISQKQCEKILEEMINPKEDLRLTDSRESGYSYVGFATWDDHLPPLGNPNFHIDSIIEVEEVEELIEDVPHYSKKEIRLIDSLTSIDPSILPPPAPVTGVIMTPNELTPNPKRQSLNLDTIPEIEEVEEEFLMGFVVEEIPRFHEAKNLPMDTTKEDFNKRMISFFSEHFNAPQQSLGLKSGSYQIIIFLTIDEKGEVSKVNVKAPHKAFEKEAKRVVKMLPKFIPGTQRGIPIQTNFTIPIKVEIE